MDYIEIEKEYFQNYVIGGSQGIDMYIQFKRQDTVWGDDLEIQAMSEIYNRAVELYAYSCEPMRTFHENNEEILKIPIKLSYHGN